MMFDTIHEPNAMTHMPFLTRDGDGRHVLFYCRSGPEDVDAPNQARRWKLSVTIEGEQPRKLATGLSDDLADGEEDADPACQAQDRDEEPGGAPRELLRRGLAVGENERLVAARRVGTDRV